MGRGERGASKNGGRKNNHKKCSRFQPPLVFSNLLYLVLRQRHVHKLLVQHGLGSEVGGGGADEGGLRFFWGGGGEVSGGRCRRDGSLSARVPPPFERLVRPPFRCAAPDWAPHTAMLQTGAAGGGSKRRDGPPPLTAAAATDRRATGAAAGRATRPTREARAGRAAEAREKAIVVCVGGRRKGGGEE